jgi:hypothetical protein
MLARVPLQDRVAHTAFTICCSCSDMPALGFIAAGMEPTPPGKAIFKSDYSCDGKKGRGNGDEVAKAMRCAAAGNFCGVQSGGRKMPDMWVLALTRTASVIHMSHVPRKRFDFVEVKCSDSHYASNDGLCLPEARFQYKQLRQRHAVPRTFPHNKPPLRQVLRC